jgi:YbbR domain-containing protein
MKKLEFKKIFYNDQALKLFALVAAVLLWFIVVSNVSPDYTRTVSGVDISVNQKSGVLAEQKLHVIDQSSKTVSIEVSGPRYLIGKLTASDFTAKPYLEPVSGTGKYTLGINADFNYHDARMRIVRVKSSSVDFTFDTYSTRTLPVTVKLQSQKVADGYVAESPQAAPDSVTVTGPTSIVTKIAQAAVTVGIDGSATKTQQTQGSLQYYGSDGKEIVSSYLTVDQKNIKVTVPVAQVKENIPLKVTVANMPSGIDQSIVQCTVSPLNIRIAGDESVLSGISEIDLGTIDFMNLDLTNRFTMNVTLPDGVFSPDKVKTAAVNILLSGITSKTLSAGNFSLANVPSGYRAEILTPSVDNIKVFGPSSAIGTLTSLTGTIDLSQSFKGTGRYTVPASIQLPSQACWTASACPVEIRVKR